MTDYKAMIEEHSCKPNQGCGVMTICMCGVAEDMADEIERLREALHECARYLEEQVSASYWHIEQPFDANTQRRYDRDMARAHKAFAALREKES